jgi:TrpR family transcriptional regulator, trp operon repressor
MAFMESSKDLSKFLRLCLSAKSPQALSQLFSLFMTFEERKMLAARYKIIQLLLKGNISQRAIANQLQVSIAQITRGSNELKNFPDLFKKKLKKHFAGKKR